MGSGATDFSGYDVKITEKLKDQRIWRALVRGYMGVSYKDTTVETDDDWYAVTKAVIHCIVQNKKPSDIYEIPNRVASTDTDTLEDLQRRSKKVIKEADKLYDYAINGTDKYAKPTISIQVIGDFKSEGNNMVQTLKINTNAELGNYDVKISNFPKGTTYTKSDNIVKVIIPKENIIQDINGTVNISNAEVKSYPVFYANALNEEWQDYEATGQIYEKVNSKINLKLDANESTMKILKKDSETKEIIPNTVFQIEKDGEVLKTVITNKNGEAILDDIYPGTYKITEIKANESYVLNKNTQEITLKYNQAQTIEFYNMHKKGNLKIIKVDRDDNDLTLGAVEFDLIDSKGKIIKHLITDVNGVAEVKNINTGNYTLRETLTKKEYNLAVDQDVVVNWNETMEVKVENEKKKGQIKIIKVDDDYNEVKLEGVEFQIIDKNNHVIETIKTNSEGVAVTSRIPIGDYKIKESSLGTNEEYILNNEIKTIVVEEDKIKTIQFENEHKKGNLKIYKVDLDDNTIPVPDVEFEITDQDGYKYTAISDENGIAYIQDIRTGIATIKELKTNKIYKLSDETYNAEINWDKTTEITITNEKLKGQIEVYKIDAEDKEIKLEGVEFQVINSNNEVVETIVTNSEGYAITSRIPIGEYRFKGDKNR